jgi:hypothetical protein
LGWELRRLRDEQHLDRTIVLVPPVGRDEVRARLLALADVLEIAPAELDWEQPGVETVAVLFDQGDGGRILPIPIVSRARDDVSYRVAIQVAQETLAWLRSGGRWWASERRPAAPPYRFRQPLWFQAGKAPRGRPWYLRFSTVVWALALPVLLLATFVGQVVGDVTPVERQLLRGTAPGLILNDADSDAMYAVDGEDGSVYELDVASGASEEIGELDLDSAVEGVVAGGWVLAASPLDDAVAALSLDDGTTWSTATLGDAPRGVLVHDGRGFVALAGDGAVVEVDLATGAEVARVQIPGAFGLAAEGDDVLVSSASEDEVVVLGPDLEVISTRPVASPRELVAGGAGLYAWDARDGVLWHLGDGGVLSQPTAERGSVLLAGNGRQVALSTDVEQERIEVLDADGDSTTSYLLDSPAAWIGLTDDGRLLATFDGFGGVYLVERPD